jgi:DNA (cytosine-5)-methyltransferase 1
VLNCVDLFAGAGGFSLAARLAGFDLRLAIENNHYAVQTYRENMCGETRNLLILEGDIAQMDADKVYKNTFQTEESCDLLLGGPPCQGFSTHRINDSGVADTRNDLIHTYFDFVRRFAPAAFLMENVPGMLWPRHSETLSRFYREGHAAGYQVFQPLVVDARDYGVPQRRKRVFILGLRQGISSVGFNWPPSPTHGSEQARQHSPQLEPWVDCSSAFAPAPLDDPNDVHMQHGSALTEAFKNTPHNGGSRKASGRLLKCHENHDGHKDVYGRIDPTVPGPTMTTACINPSKGRFVHPTQDHGITVRQAARMQTFPDTFRFHGGLTAAGQQVGNAVPVVLATALIEHLKQIILKSQPIEAARRRQAA